MRVLHIYAKAPNSGDQLIGYATEIVCKQSLPITSWQSRNIRKLVTAEDVEDFNKNFDLLIIGPGGIFLYDNTNASKKDLAVSGYQWLISRDLLHRLTTPIAVLAAGWNQFRGHGPISDLALQNIGLLIEKSIYFSLRHKDDISSLLKVVKADKHKIRHCFCPTTALPSLVPVHGSRERVIAIQIAGDRESLRYASGRKQLFEEIEKFCKKWILSGYTIHVVDQCCDSAIYNYLKNKGVPASYVKLTGKGYKQQLDYYRKISALVATRGHAQMVPISCGTPVVTIISHNKVKYFLDDLEILVPTLKVKNTGIESRKVTEEGLSSCLRNALSIPWLGFQQPLYAAVAEELDYLEGLL